MGVLYELIQKEKEPYGTFQLVRINPSGGVIKVLKPWKWGSTFQLVRINPSGGESLGEFLGVYDTTPFQLVRINPSGGGDFKAEFKNLQESFPISPH